MNPRFVRIMEKLRDAMDARDAAELALARHRATPGHSEEGAQMLRTDLAGKQGFLDGTLVVALIEFEAERDLCLGCGKNRYADKSAACHCEAAHG